MYTIRRPPIKNVSLFTNVSQGRGHENVVEVHIQHVILHRMCMTIEGELCLLITVPVFSCARGQGMPRG